VAIADAVAIRFVPHFTVTRDRVQNTGSTAITPEVAVVRRLPLLITIALAGAGLAACGGSASGSEVTPTTPPSPAATVAVSPTKAAGSPAASPTQAASPSAGASPTATAEAATATTAPATATTAPVENTTAPQPTTAPPTPTPPPSSGNPLSASVGVTGSVRFFWAPNAVTIAPGGTVTWSWSGPTQPHNVSGTDFALSTAPLKADSASFTFSAPGVYHFVCDIHPDTMVGTVTVQ